MARAYRSGCGDGEVLPGPRLCAELAAEPLGGPGCRAGSCSTRIRPRTAPTFWQRSAPPTAPVPEQLAPREVLLLIDHSGSMEGAKWQAADWTVKRFLSELGPRIRSTSGLFHDTTALVRRATTGGRRGGRWRGRLTSWSASTTAVGPSWGGGAGAGAGAGPHARERARQVPGGHRRPGVRRWPAAGVGGPRGATARSGAG